VESKQRTQNLRVDEADLLLTLNYVLLLTTEENYMIGNRDSSVKLATETADVCEVDELCFQWLELALLDNGTDGEIGRKLLKIVKELMP
jgi:hypothetical protein